MMANGENIARDTRFEPERRGARVLDRDLRCRGLSSGRAVKALQLRRRIHGRSRSSASFNRKTLAPREPSIHGPSNNGGRQLAFEDLSIALAEVEAEKETRAAKAGDGAAKPAPKRISAICQPRCRASRKSSSPTV